MSAIVLKGHKETVLCLAVSRNSELASGGEDKTVRTWDTATGKTARALAGFKDDITAIKYHGDHDYLLSAASGCIIKTFDLRCDHSSLYSINLFRKDGVVLFETVWECCASADEINDLDIDAKGEIIAAASDTGDVTLFSAESGHPHRIPTLSGVHNNICTGVRFTEGHYLVTGGLDCSVVKWHDGKGDKVSLTDQIGTSCNAKSISNGKDNTMDSVSEVPEAQANQHISPPLIYSIDVSNCGCMAAAALGNGTIPVFSMRGDSIWSVVATCGGGPGGILIGHRSSVSQVRFPRFASADWLVSGGNDGQIMFWHLLHTCADFGCDWEPTRVDVDEDDDEDAMPVWRADHGKQVNALETLVQGEGLIAVADVGCNISLYAID